MYKLNKEFIHNRIKEISGTDKFRHYERHTYPFTEAAEAIVRVSGVDPDIVFAVINKGDYIEDEDFVISVAKALDAQVEEVASSVEQEDNRKLMTRDLRIPYIYWCDVRRIASIQEEKKISREEIHAFMSRTMGLSHAEVEALLKGVPTQDAKRVSYLALCLRYDSFGIVRAKEVGILRSRRQEPNVKEHCYYSFSKDEFRKAIGRHQITQYDIDLFERVYNRLHRTWKFDRMMQRIRFANGEMKLCAEAIQDNDLHHGNCLAIKRRVEKTWRICMHVIY
ncbi:hypothetical protein SAMN04487861_11130 [Selenomonas ruminantium]|uniref:Uncharacterized protein n=1 Tax=Selenomonas ruminantium TaxID=971 RepID=A0A1I3EQ61_SELRU|nr:hypothetical protein [Selenomonas ruminantium]SFI01048.1 hypothetical protein SAMN04487861_11130 [Selenomonas ruminantium]